jgi:hypothetical protein
VALSRAEVNLLFAYDEEAKAKAEEVKKEN